MTNAAELDQTAYDILAGIPPMLGSLFVGVQKNLHVKVFPHRYRFFRYQRNLLYQLFR